MTVEGETKLKNKERQKCEIWTRIMGYFRPVSGYNPGKKAEFYERRYFSEEKALENINSSKDSDTDPASPDQNGEETTAPTKH